MSDGVHMDLAEYLEKYAKGQAAGKEVKGRGKHKAHNQENVVQASIIHYLQMSPLIAWVRRHNSGKVKTEWGTWVELGEKGDSDVFGMFSANAGAFAGKFLGIEVKDGDNKPTAEQLAFIRMVNDNGGVGFAAWSVDDVIREFAERGIL